MKLSNKLLKANLLTTSIASLFFTTFTVGAAQNPPPTSLAKHVAVAAENLAEQKLPSAQSKGIFSHSSMLPILIPRSTSGTLNAKSTSQATNQPLTINQSILFDGESNSPLVFISPDSEQWLLTVTDPDGRQVLNETNATNNRLTVENITVGQKSFKGKQLLIKTPIAGKWNVQLTRNERVKNSTSVSSTNDKIDTANQPIGYLLFKGDPNFKLYSHLDDNLTILNRNINVVAYMVNAKTDRGDRELMLRKHPLQGMITKATARITTPGNNLVKLDLADDGLNGDKLAGDGVFSAKIPTHETGVYTSQVTIEGIRSDGIRFSRTTTDLYPVEAPAFNFTQAAANLTLSGQTTGIVSVPVKQLEPETSVFMAGEIWGTDAYGLQKPAAWIGGIVSPEKSNQNANLNLSFDIRWLKRAKLTAPFVLKSLRLQTVNTNVPIAQVEQLPLNLSHQTSRNLQAVLAENKWQKNALDGNLEITPEMLRGKPPVSLNKTTQAASGSALMLVHGYCSGGVWNTNHFTNSIEFQDYKKNRTHDEFAQLIKNFGASYSSFGVVAHSQGGAAALHLLAKYWTGLDNASGGRKIQSLGTPYQGTALAGNAALLGQLFGIGCGPNTDMTYSGAANWLATIPSWARAEVDYYTTSFKTRWWAYDYCHLATDLFLDDPEDGTTEKWAGQLSGAVNKGHKKGWCHTTGMRDTAQYKDSSRNSSMNSRAAR
ncbi:choice-of-anchor X domain-containing protein [Aliikangiella coralliicola]|uniref:Conditioned medium factor n=1 Tax=Aliikangiella coralliicola TaxID=2592383 RepID=A0A545U6F7_9GAMM|nr:choice-of-anchor X domain-containing protein [Aliikangiella coralliicola]TQV85014.1 hypothetical protein FLL46_21735 [Aliikangiella coralliicola]